MTFALLFWIIMLLWLIFSLRGNWPLGPTSFWPFGGSVILFILLFIIGLQIFGDPIHR